MGQKTSILRYARICVGFIWVHICRDAWMRVRGYERVCTCFRGHGHIHRSTQRTHMDTHTHARTHARTHTHTHTHMHTHTHARGTLTGCWHAGGTLGTHAQRSSTRRSPIDVTAAWSKSCVSRMRATILREYSAWGTVSTQLGVL